MRINGESLMLSSNDQHLKLGDYTFGGNSHFRGQNHLEYPLAVMAYAALI